MNTFIKTAALATALTLGGTIASADNFGFQTQVDDSGSIMINLIRATEPGVVVVYDYTGGEVGSELGMAELNAGVNTDVLVNLSNNIAQDVIAITYAGAASDPANGIAMMEFEVMEQ